MMHMNENGPPLGATDRARWRLCVSDGGRHVWHYLASDTEAAAWPQTTEDKYWLGLDTGLPNLKRAGTALEAAENGVAFYRHLQSTDGHFAGEYGGPMFLLPGLVIGMYVTDTPIPEPWKIEIARYLWHRRSAADGGWGIHVEGKSTVFGTALNYVVLRIVGVHADHPMMVRARNTLHRLGGASAIPSWGKLWLAILNVYDWDGLNPVPPELWLLPDSFPLHPWRWWIHTRMVYLPMGFLFGSRFRAPLDPLIESLREELYPQPYAEIYWPAQRNKVASVDLYAPHTQVVDALFAVICRYERWHNAWMRKKGMDRAYNLIVREDENTAYQCLGPVNKMLNMVCRYAVDGPESHAMKLHREKLKDFAWMGAEGLMMTGTNGSQLWDTTFFGQALVDAGLAARAENREICARVLSWLDACQIRENPRYFRTAYRFPTKGAWPFSTREQGYTVSDCTAEGLKGVLMLQEDARTGLGHPISRARMHDSVDLLLSMQNPGGGYASYETINGPALTEWLNPAEVFGGIMVEYAYPECTTSVVTALRLFQRYDSYRSRDIDRTVAAAVAYILREQRPDGSWLGSWAICFTYAAMFALESLHHAGLTCANSEQVRRACGFLVGKQQADGGWGESYKSCETGEYVQTHESQVVQTAWAVIALLHAKYPDQERIKRGIRLIMQRQQPNGSWAQEHIEGIFNRYEMESRDADALTCSNCAISYPNYKFSFTIWALGKAARELDA
ncbi:lanosterol synthase [Malassezia sp. CBS 17886]|nr:lanosterol synthase [Malassezia sp. CBS 17886]